GLAPSRARFGGCGLGVRCGFDHEKELWAGSVPSDGVAEITGYFLSQHADRTMLLATRGGKTELLEAALHFAKRSQRESGLFGCATDSEAENVSLAVDERGDEVAAPFRSDFALQGGG